MTYLLPLTDQEHDRWCSWNNAFNEEELKSVIDVCSKLKLKDSTIQTGEGVDDIARFRNNQNAAVIYLPETAFIYERLALVLSKINSTKYQFDLTGIDEPIQYSEYQKGEHYNAWHVDSIIDDAFVNMPRKLSLTLQLSRPEEYEGGELQFRYSQDADTFTKEYGTIAVFPSYTLHRVTPVTKGLRKSLVVWVGGPKFK